MTLRAEPLIKRTVAFFDGQNLFYAAKNAFDCRFPNYDPRALALAVCRSRGWQLTGVHFYTGISEIDIAWNRFWNAKLAVMGTRGVRVVTPRLKYSRRTVALPDGTSKFVLVEQEKGIDVRIALDVVSMARQGIYDVAVIFSQNQGLVGAVDEVKSISVAENRWLRVACAFPVSPTYSNTRGINGTEWISIDRPTYNACIDPADYREKPAD